MNGQWTNLVLGIILSIAAILCLALYAFCIVDIHRHKVKYQSKRSLWLNFIWGAPVVGCLIYLLKRKNIWKKTDSSF